MRLGRFISSLALWSVIAAVAATGTAGADANGDYASIRADFAKDGIIAPCAWTTAQLDNALKLADGNPEDQYNGFAAAVEGELKRWRDGRCKPVDRRYSIVVSATPRSVRVGQYRTFTFRVAVRYQGRSIPVRGAKIRFAGKVRTTGANGVASLRIRFAVKGTRVAVFTRAARRLGSVSVSVLAPPPKRKRR